MEVEMQILNTLLLCRSKKNSFLLRPAKKNSLLLLSGM
jgi:hypothetical protein